MFSKSRTGLGVQSLISKNTKVHSVFLWWLSHTERGRWFITVMGHMIGTQFAAVVVSPIMIIYYPTE
jgi:hypothetical protein